VGRQQEIAGGSAYSSACYSPRFRVHGFPAAGELAALKERFVALDFA
jgi:hypothetical protein